MHVFANATAFLIAPHANENSVEVGEVAELLTDNAPLALNGTLWELDQKLTLHATDESQLPATLSAFAEQCMEKVALRAQNAPRLAPFSDAVWRIEATT